MRLRGYKLKDPLERMRFFCSLALNDQDLLDVESFFDDVLKPNQMKLLMVVVDSWDVFWRHRELAIVAKGYKKRLF